MISAENNASPIVDHRFPKSARLLKKRDFRFRPYKRFQTENFNFLYTQNGCGRLGISIAKKILRRAAARNRVRRLLREAFRLKLHELAGYDIHVIGQGPLSGCWTELKRSDLEAQFERFKTHTQR